ncbi:hypothetical protein DPMN_052304 [Dreissena polymorpha]|uniref:Uncharacterized protein n=1 Tax=Dreissena polymorpha TaxID=45954 RepID=A0A9D4CK83_DREPO|nr:hypothetical protein DPMN_052304 [Dreissena polymorpha]
MRGRGARRKAGTQKRPRSVIPDGNSHNEGDQGKKDMGFEQQLREAENMPMVQAPVSLQVNPFMLV